MAANTVLDDGRSRLEICLDWGDPVSPGEKLDEGYWLYVSVRAETPHGAWEVERDPALMAGDVVSLIRWLRAVAGHRYHTEEESFLEPNLNFTHLAGDDHSHIRLRVGLEQEFTPPESMLGASGLSEYEFHIDFDLTAEQVSLAADALEHNVRSLLAEIGDDGSDLFATPQLLPRFVASWIFLPRAAATREEAMQSVETYVRDRTRLPLEIESCEPGQTRLVRARTELPVAGVDCAEALFYLLSRLPAFNGVPSVFRLHKSTEGYCHCHIFFVERRESSTAFEFVDMRWRCVLANFVMSDLSTFDPRLALAYVAGEVDSQGRPLARDQRNE